MFCLHPTLSLSKRLGVRLNKREASFQQPGPMTEWYGNDFRLGHSSFVMFVNPETCLPVVMKAVPYRDLVVRLQVHLPVYLQTIGWADAQSTLASQFAEGIEYFRTQDRSTLGVIVDFIKQLKAEHEYGLLDIDAPAKMSLRLSDTPIGGARRYRSPIDMFQRAVGIESSRTRRHLRLMTR